MAKMETLEEATATLQRLHGIVERMAIALQKREPLTPYGLQLRRAGGPLVGLLKGQFGMMADHLSSMLLIATRGGGEQSKVRALREGVAQLRQQLEIATTRVIEKHTVPEEPTSAT